MRHKNWKGNGDGKTRLVITVECQTLCRAVHVFPHLLCVTILLNRYHIVLQTHSHVKK